MISYQEKITISNDNFKERILSLIQQANFLTEQANLEKAVNSLQKLITTKKSRIKETIKHLIKITPLGWTLQVEEELNLSNHQQNNHLEKKENQQFLEKIIYDIENRTDEYLTIIKNNSHLVNKQIINSLHVIQEWKGIKSPSNLHQFEEWGHYFDLTEHYNFIRRTVTENLTFFKNIHLELN